MMFTADPDGAGSTRISTTGRGRRFVPNCPAAAT